MSNFPARPWAARTFFAALLLSSGAALADGNGLASKPLLPLGTGNSLELHWDRNGRFAVFTSSAGNLVPGQDTVGRNVFLYDRLADSVRLVSHVPGLPEVGGDQGTEVQTAPQISADGKWVTYVSASTDLVAGQSDLNSGNDVFLWDRENATTFLVSRRATAATAAGNGPSELPKQSPAISNDGRYVVYASLATDLVAGQAFSAFQQLFQFDRASGASVLISHASAGLVQPGNGQSNFEGLTRGRIVSGDGRWVVFETLATNLVGGVTDGNGSTDVYLWERDAPLASSLRLLSRRAGAPLVAGNGVAGRPVISADGSAVAFHSNSADLEGPDTDTNGAGDVFRYDLEADRLELVSHAALSDTRTADAGSVSPSISADGKRIAFQSRATNLVFQQVDGNGDFDVFFWQGAGHRLISHVPDSPRETGNGSSSEPLLAADGSGVAFVSLATDLTAETDSNAANDVYWRLAGSSNVSLVSHVPDLSAAAESGSRLSEVAVNGALIAFTSEADDLTTAPNNSGADVFFHGSLVMADGFESGDLSAWSQHVP